MIKNRLSYWFVNETLVELMKEGAERMVNILEQAGFTVVREDEESAMLVRDPDKDEELMVIHTGSDLFIQTSDDLEKGDTTFIDEVHDIIEKAAPGVYPGLREARAERRANAPGLLRRLFSKGK